MSDLVILQRGDRVNEGGYDGGLVHVVVETADYAWLGCKRAWLRKVLKARLEARPPTCLVCAVRSR